MSKFLVTKKVFEENQQYNAEIEYLESTGTQYIDTGIVLKPKYKYEVTFSCTSTNTDSKIFFGMYSQRQQDGDQAIKDNFAANCMGSWGTNNATIAIYSYPDNGIADSSFPNAVQVASRTVEVRYGEPNTVSHDSGVTYFNGQEIINRPSSMPNNPYNIPSYLFAAATRQQDTSVKPAYFFIGRIMSAKIKDAEYNIIRDFIPVRAGNVGYMYDKISKQLFGNLGTESFILGPDTKIIEPEIPNENQPSSKFIIGKKVINITNNVNPNFSVIKKHFETKFQLSFDTNGGNIIESKEVVLGKPYGELPVPIKSQHIFLGWFTTSSGGTQITSETLVSLDINKLYAHWEEVQIDPNNCTSYSVTTTSSYKNTGIYVASISNSSQPIYIDWGDGTVEKLTSSISQKSYTYKTNGNFIVKISDNITSFAPSYNNSAWYETTSQNRYTFKGMLTTGSKITSLPTYAFYYCSAMTNIDFMQTCWPTVTSIPNYCFSYCSSLTSIQGAKRFTSLGVQCFRYCSGLTGVQDLSEFKFTTLSTAYIFGNCTNVIQWILPNEFIGTRLGNYMFANNSMLKYIGMKNYDVVIENNNNQSLPYDAEIEYIEYTASSGAYIDTQLIPTSKGKWELDAQIVSTSGGSRFLAACPTGSSEPCLALAVPDSGTGWYAYKYSNNWIDPNMSINTSIRHTIKYYFQHNSQQVYVDDVLKSNSTNSWSTSSVTSIKMFSIPNGRYNSRTIRIFRCKIYDQNDILIGDFIPVRIGDVGYMYDKISNKLFGNIGSGKFILGIDINNINNINQTTSKLPESLTAIGAYTFQNCSNLKNIIIPSKISAIGTYAFYDCTQLSSINIGNTSLITISPYTFYGCGKLTDLDLPDTVKTIGNYAFYGCASLNYVGRIANDLPYDAEIEYLENDGKQWIDTEIIPTESDEAEMLVYFKSDDSSGSKILFGTATPRLWVTTGTCRFNEENNCSINTKRILNEWNSIKINKDICVCNGTEIQMSDGTFQFTQNTVWLFGVNSSLAKTNARIKSFIWKRNNIEILNFIPVRVGNVGYMYDKVSGQLFGNSGTGNFILGPDVKSKELPSQLTSIGSYAYQGCNSLKSLNIPENLQTIGDYAFAGCYQISSIVDKRLTAQTVSTNTFGNTTGTGTNAYTGYKTKGNNVISTYFATTGYDENAWDDPLQNLEKCGFIQQYIDPENVVYYTVTFDVGNGSITETSKQIVKDKKIGELPEPTCPDDMPYFGGWYTAANGEGNRITKDYRVISDITLYALYSVIPFASYEVILNDQWQASTIANPDSNQFDGVYESFSNYNVGSKASVMYIKITGYTTFTIYIRSNAESSYDYAIAFNLDTYTPSNPLTSNPSSSTSGVKVHTSSKQNSGTTIESYTKVEYTEIDGGEHYICIAYRKDGSVNNGTDRGYVLINKQI